MDQNIFEDRMSFTKIKYFKVKNNNEWELKNILLNTDHLIKLEYDNKFIKISIDDKVIFIGDYLNLYIYNIIKKWKMISFP